MQGRPVKSILISNSITTEPLYNDKLLSN
uniref:Uncharacterized protein n=1 Tax=Romanomermis culicivorax TaxID=13658 RepID=A0A915HZ91_ROMCU